MRIAIDARLYGPAKNKGLGRYVEQLVKNLEKIDSKNEYVVLLRKENWDEYRSGEFTGSLHSPSAPPRRGSGSLGVGRDDNGGNFKKVLADYKWYSWAEQIFLPLKLWRLKCDLVHFPHFNVPLLYRGKFVVTIHDLIMYKFPNERMTTRNKWIYKIKYWLHKVVVKSAVKRAKKVIAVSEWTKRDVVDEFGVEAGKVEVIYEGCNPNLQMHPNATNSTNDAKMRNVREKYGISGPYLLYVGNAYPHKNLERLIRAVSDVGCRMSDVGFKNLQLVLVGKEDYFYKKLKAYSLKLTADIIFTDHVSNGELVQLYQNAEAYVFPSLYEGFGLPGLEAMSYGVPVVSSNASCLPEIYGEAALYFEPTDIGDISRKIIQILGDEVLRRSLVKKGFERIKKYSWQGCAEKTLESYAHLLC